MRWETYLVVLACLPGILETALTLLGCGYTDWMDSYITAGMDARLRFHQNPTFLAQYSVLQSDYRWIRIANGMQQILSIANYRYFVENAVLKITDVTPADEGAYVVECWHKGTTYTYYRTPAVHLKLAQATTTTASPIVRTTAPATTHPAATTDDANRNTIIAILVAAVFIAMVSVAAIIVTRRTRKLTKDTQPSARSIRNESEKSEEPACNVAEAETMEEHIMHEYDEIGAVQTGLKITINRQSHRHQPCEIADMLDYDDATVLSNSNTSTDTLVYSVSKTVDAQNTIEIENDYLTMTTDLARGGACVKTTDDMYMYSVVH